MDKKKNYTFYAFNVNGNTNYIYPDRQQAIDELTIRLNEDDDPDTYEIEPLNGIWELLYRYSGFEDRHDDEWMSDVIQVVCQMIFDKEDERVLSKSEKEESKDHK